MASRSVNVTFIPPDTVSTGPGENRLEVFRGRDTVTWNLNGFGGQPVEVAFHVFMPDGGSPPTTGLSPFGSPLPPTTGTTIGPANVPSTAAKGLYIYKLLRNDELLQWDPQLFTVGSFDGNFGGIIVRDPPGQPGSAE